MSTFTVRFELYGDVVIDADSMGDAEKRVAEALTRWNGLSIPAEEVLVDGVTIHDDMTEAAS